MIEQNDGNGGQNLIGAAAGAGVEVTRKDFGDGKLSTGTGIISDHLICSLQSELQLQREDMERQHQHMQQQLGEIKSLILSTTSCSTAHPNQNLPPLGYANDDISVVNMDKPPPQQGMGKVEWQKIRKEPAVDKGMVGTLIAL